MLEAVGGPEIIWFMRFSLVWAYAGFATCALAFYADILRGEIGLALLMLLCLAVNAACVASNTNVLEQEAQK